MKQQIKIVISYDDCEAEDNHVSTHVYFNNDKISFIQNLSVNADVDKPSPEINLTFPSLEKIRIGKRLLRMFFKSWKKFERAFVAVIDFILFKQNWTRLLALGGYFIFLRKLGKIKYLLTATSLNFVITISLCYLKIVW
jgi:hypothetical protein